MRLMEAVARYGSVRAFWEAVYDGRIELSFLDGFQSAPFPREVAGLLLPLDDPTLVRCSHFPAFWVDVPGIRQFYGLAIRRFTEPPPFFDPAPAPSPDPAPNPGAPRGPEITRVIALMRQEMEQENGRARLVGMSGKEMQARYKSSARTCGRARKIVLAEKPVKVGN
jgi:hypothetical protein